MQIGTQLAIAMQFLFDLPVLEVVAIRQDQRAANRQEGSKRFGKGLVVPPARLAMPATPSNSPAP